MATPTSSDGVMQAPEAGERLLALADAAVAIAQAPTLADAIQVLTDRSRELVGAELAVTTLAAEPDAQPVNAVSRSDPLAGAPTAAAAGENGAIHAPLVARDGTTLGMLQLSRKGQGAFDEQDEATLIQLAHLGAALIENVRLIELMQRARADADVANRAKSDFLATMSHEIRTPINAVLGYTELLEIGISGPLTATQRQHLSRIRASSVHLLRLVDEVLDLSRIEAGRLELQLGVHRIADAADLALALVRPMAEERGIALDDRCTVQSDLQYRGDPDRVRQILLNLLSNAVKFTEPGGTVTFECGELLDPPDGARLSEGEWVHASVQDTGIGIPRDLLHRIFDPFERGESGHTRRHGGSGLGLAISRRLARAMGGEITLESRPGAGSTFSLWLPSARSPVRDGAPPSTADLAAQYSRITDHTLQRGGAALLGASQRLQQEFTAALRADQNFEVIRALPDAVLSDHIPTLLADVATCLRALHYGLDTPLPLLSDGTRIQRLVAERHGEQRAQLGLSERAIRREHEILRDQLARTIRRDLDQGASGEEIQDLVELVNGMIHQAEYTSVLAARRTHIR